MGRKKKSEESVADRMPSDPVELKKIVDTFMDRYTNVQNEMELLKEDEVNLIEEFSDRLDMKTLKQAIRAVKLAKKVNHKDTFEQFVEIINQRESV